MKNKYILILTVMLLAVGFAAVSTTLIINGNARVSENNEDFSVIFTKASLDGEDVYSSIVNDTKKVITFTSKDLSKVGDKSTLTYEVTNNSANYDAEVQVNCKVKENTTVKFTSIKNELENNATVIKAKETLNGTLTITLNKSSTEEVRENYVCTLTLNADERDTLGEKFSGPTEWTFDYTGGEQVFIVPTNGKYKIETWGAEGASSKTASNTVSPAGVGAYSVGIYNASEEDILYVNVGGKGSRTSATMNNFDVIISETGGYNGGGTANGGHGSGGGATHVSLSSGLLSSFNNNLKDLIIVSGGGGGASRTCGGAAGGYIANEACSDTSAGGLGGSQVAGGAGAHSNHPNFSSGTHGVYNTYGDSGIFGKGGNSGLNGGAGGGGFYGGGGGCTEAKDTGGGGGSGYIGNVLLAEKSMYCYNCRESDEEGTKTISTTCVSETPTENCAKQGNGYARITLIK